MNIFYLDEDYKVAAAYHCDKHVIGMIKETAQMLCTAHRVLDGNEYADTHLMCAEAHVNHPSTQWVRGSAKQYKWAYNLFCELIKEQKRRYGTLHTYARLMKPLMKKPTNISNGVFIQPPQCMPDEYKCVDSVEAYRQFYAKDKVRFARWEKLGNEPMWFTMLIHS